MLSDMVVTPPLCPSGSTYTRKTLVKSGVLSSLPCGLLHGSFPAAFSRRGLKKPGYVMLFHLDASEAVTQLQAWSVSSWQASFRIAFGWQDLKRACGMVWGLLRPRDGAHPLLRGACCQSSAQRVVFRC